MPPKRKPDTDMVSPPKRVTRARTAKAVVVEPEPATAAIKAKAAAGKAKKAAATTATAPARGGRRKAAAVEVVAEEKPEKPAPKARQTKKTASVVEAEKEVVDGEEKTVKPRGRAPRAATVQVTTESVKSRGRPKRNQDVDVAVEKETEVPTKRATRSRPATKATTTTRKKVQFEDEQDKENIPVRAEVPSKTTGKRTARAAAAPKRATTTRSTRRNAAPAEETMPLSPKKVNQVAKTPSVSEDELASGEKTPLKALSKSPVRPQVVPDSPTRTATSPVRHASPLRPAGSPSRSVLGSPARRLPKSPFKDSLRDSPKKFAISGGSPGKLSFDKVMKTSPAKTSLLKESPKKGALGSSMMLSSVLAPSGSPLKSSLLLSPAKRPFVSPLKASRKEDVQSPKAVVGAVSAQADEPLVSEKDDVDLVPEIITEQEPAQPEAELQDESEDSVIHHDVPNFVNPTWRRISSESQLSEDELASPDKKFAPTPLKRVAGEANTPAAAAGEASFTPLVGQMDKWTPSTMAKQRPPRQKRGVFSLDGGQQPMDQAAPAEETVRVQPPKTSFFEDEMALMDAPEVLPSPAKPATEAPEGTDLAVSMESQASQEYGDENAIPPEAQLLRAQQEASEPTITCTPARVFTPAKQAVRQPSEVHTVSKVPLRATAEDSALRLPRKRSRSFGGALALIDQEPTPQRFAFNIDALITKDIPNDENPVTPTLRAVPGTRTPSSHLRLDHETPGRTARKRGTTNILQGAVVYVDVHTSEGADASSIFIDLLTQMGARCVKQWTWNPGASLQDVPEGVVSPPPASASASKPGITHVVYKDGGVRTLEKVRLSSGVVLCVGVGWVLDCEREDKWLDETPYAIDSSCVPRGGQRRRKSMEPRALANLGGNLVLSPTKEFLNLQSPAPAPAAERRETLGMNTADPSTDITPMRLARTLPDTPGVPATPGEASPAAELVQRTCPPKQQGRAGLFSGAYGDDYEEEIEVGGEPSDELRRKVLLAKRKSLQWESRTKSPLGRVVSYGK